MSMIPTGPVPESLQKLPVAGGVDTTRTTQTTLPQCGGHFEGVEEGQKLTKKEPPHWGARVRKIAEDFGRGALGTVCAIAAVVLFPLSITGYLLRGLGDFVTSFSHTGVASHTGVTKEQAAIGHKIQLAGVILGAPLFGALWAFRIQTEIITK